MQNAMFCNVRPFFLSENKDTFYPLPPPVRNMSNTALLIGTATAYMGHG